MSCFMTFGVIALTLKLFCRILFYINKHINKISYNKTALVSINKDVTNTIFLLQFIC